MRVYSTMLVYQIKSDIGQGQLQLHQHDHIVQVSRIAVLVKFSALASPSFHRRKNNNKN